MFGWLGRAEDCLEEHGLELFEYLERGLDVMVTDSCPGCGSGMLYRSHVQNGIMTYECGNCGESITYE